MAKPLPLLVGVLGIGATATGGVILMNRNGSGEGNGTAVPSNAVTTPTTEGAPSGEVNARGQPGAAGGAPAGTAQSGQTGNGAAGAGGASGAAGGAGQGGGGGQGQNTQGQAQQPQQPAVTDLIFDGIDAFKTNGPSNSECLKTDWTGLTLSGDSLGEEFTAGKPESTKFFKGASGDTTPDSKSCLIINWKKSKDANNKWTGKFTWLWTFQKENEGFITFNVMEPGVESGKAKFTGVFYLVEKNNTNWEVKYKKEVTVAKESNKDKLDEYFPKVGTDLKSENTDLKDYWGLMDNKDKLDEICTGSDSCGGQVETKELQWTAKTSGQAGTSDKALKDWTSTGTWWEKIYEDIKDHWKFSEKIQGFKGKWVLKTTPQESQ